LYAARHPRLEKARIARACVSFGSRWPQMLGEPAMEQWKRTNTLEVFHYSEGVL